MLVTRSILAQIFVFFVLATNIALFCPSAHAQNSLSLGEAIASGDSDLIWDSLYECNVVFDSNSDKPGTFEFSTRNFNDHSFKRIQIAMDKGILTFAASNELAIPLAIGDQDGRYTFTSEGMWQHWEAPWEICLDGQRLSVFDLKHVPPTSSAKLDVGAILHLLSQEERPPIKWHQASLTLETERSDGHHIFVRLHSPNDQMRFGTPIAGIYSMPRDRSSLLKIEAMSFRPEDIPRIEPNRLLTSSQTSDRVFTTNVPNGRSDAPNDQEELDFALASLATISDYEVPDLSQAPQRVGQEEFDKLTLRQQVALIADRLTSSIEDPEEYGQFCMLLGILDRGISEYCARSHESPLGWDDPVMRYRNAERLLGPYEAANYCMASLSFLAHENGSPSKLTLMINKLASIGPIPSDGDGELGREAWEKYPAMRPIVLSAWRRTISDDDIAACRDLFRIWKVETPVAMAAVESMINLGRIDEIPEDALDLWHSKLFVDSDSRAMAFDINALSFTPQGQDYLINHLKAKSLPDEVHKMAMEAVRARVHAVRELKRYDFISRERCARIEATLEEIQKT